MTSLGEGRDSTYWSVNARSMTAATVAKGFIPPVQFTTLLRPSHTILVGPRGSGKTTLLKMLTLEALTASRPHGRLELKHGIGFTGIFIPTDIAWSSQLAAFAEMGFDASFSDDLLQCAFTTAVLRAFVSAIGQRLRVSVEDGTHVGLAPLKISTEQEVSVAVALSDAWQLPIPVPSLLGLRSALSQRLLQLGQLASREHRLGSAGRDVRLADVEWLGQAMLPSLIAGLDALEAEYPTLQEEKWALLFDELELAPPRIRQQILSSFRSIDERLLFKVAISPFSADLSQLRSAVSSMSGHDHDEISLSYGKKEDGYSFTFELMSAILASRKHPASDLLEVFGESTFPTETSLSRKFKQFESRTESLSRQTRYLRQLDRSDKSFHQYVRKAAGDVERLLGLTGDLRAQRLRKVLPLVIVRSAFRAPDDTNGGAQRRYTSRKNPDIYAGLVSLATTLEGNPRWIIGVMHALLDETPGTTVSADRQAAEIARTVNRFRALLATIPVPPTSGVKSRGLVGFVDALGAYFRERIISDDFSPDPVGSFIVDSHASDSVLSTVALALNNGAIVHVPEAGGAAILTSLRGKRFRLSYLLATEYGLPLRLEREISLTRILEKRPENGTEEVLF